VTFVVSGRVPGVDRFYDAMRGTTAVPTKTSPAYASCGAIRGTRRASASGILIRDADILGQDRRLAKLFDRSKPNNPDEESREIEAGV